MYRVEVVTPNGNAFAIPSDKFVRLFEGFHKANAYKERNPHNKFRVVNNCNGIIEHEV